MTKNSGKKLLKNIIFILFIFIIAYFTFYLINNKNIINAQNSLTTDSVYLLALESFEKQDYVKSIELFSKYLSQNPSIETRSSSLYYMAIAYFFISKLDLSEKSFLMAMSGIISEDQRAVSLYFLGRIKFIQKNYNYAISYFKNFLDLSNNKSLIINAYFFLWQSYLEKKDNIYANKYKELFEKEVARGEILYFSKAKAEDLNQKDLQKYAEIYEMFYINQTLINQYKEIIIELTKKLEDKDLLPPINESEEKYRSLYDESVKKYNDLEKKYNDLQKTYSEFQVKYNSIQKNYNDLQKKYDDLQTKYSDLQRKYDVIQSNYNELVKKYNDFQNEYETLKAKISEGSKLEQEYSKLYTDYNELLKKYEELNKNYQEGSKTINQQELESLKKENEDLKDEINEKQKIIDQLQQQVASLEEKVEAILAAGENEIIQAYEMKFLELKKKETELNNLKTELENKQASLKDLENQLNEKENQINNWEKKLERISLVLDLKLRVVSALVDFLVKKIELFSKLISSIMQ